MTASEQAERLRKEKPTNDSKIFNSNLFTSFTNHSQSVGAVIQTLCPMNDVRQNFFNEFNFSGG